MGASDKESGDDPKITGKEPRSESRSFQEDAGLSGPSRSTRPRGEDREVAERETHPKSDGGSKRPRSPDTRRKRKGPTSSLEKDASSLRRKKDKKHKRRAERGKRRRLRHRSSSPSTSETSSSSSSSSRSSSRASHRNRSRSNSRGPRDRRSRYISFCNDISEFRPDSKDKENWDMATFFAQFEAAMQSKGYPKHQWIQRLRIQAKEPGALRCTDEAISRARQKGAKDEDLYETTKDELFETCDPDRYQVGQYVLSLRNMLNAELPASASPLEHLDNRTTTFDSWIRAYKEARERQIRKQGWTIFPKVGEGLLRVMFVLCRLPQALCDKIGLEDAQQGLTELEKKKEDEHPGAVVVSRLLAKVKNQDHRLHEGAQLENLIPVEAVAADGYRRYHQQTLELGKKYPFGGPQAQPKGRGEDDGGLERTQGLMAALRLPYRPHLEERGARRVYTERELPPRREGMWEGGPPLPRRDRSERRESSRRVAFAGRRRSRERGGERAPEQETLTRRQRAALARGRSRQDVRPCVTCNRTGHFDAECPTWLTLLKAFPSVSRMCRKCFALGHRAQVCKAERGLLWAGGRQAADSLCEALRTFPGEQTGNGNNGEQQRAEQGGKRGDERGRLCLKQGPAAFNEGEWYGAGQRYIPPRELAKGAALPKGSLEFALAAGAHPDYDIDTSGKPKAILFYMRAVALQARAEKELMHARVDADKAPLAELRGKVRSEVTVLSLIDGMRRVPRRPTQADFEERYRKDPYLHRSLIKRSSQKVMLERLLLEEWYTATTLMERAALTRRIKQLVRICGPSGSIPAELVEEAYRVFFLSSSMPGASTWRPALAAPPRRPCGRPGCAHSSILECLCRSFPTAAEEKTVAAVQGSSEDLFIGIGQSLCSRSPRGRAARHEARRVAAGRPRNLGRALLEEAKKQLEKGMRLALENGRVAAIQPAPEDKKEKEAPAQVRAHELDTIYAVSSVLNSGNLQSALCYADDFVIMPKARQTRPRPSAVGLGSPGRSLAAYVIPRRRGQTISLQISFQGTTARALYDSGSSYSYINANIFPNCSLHGFVNTPLPNRRAVSVDGTPVQVTGYFRAIVTANGLSGVVDFQTTHVMDMSFGLGVDAIWAVRASLIAGERGFSFEGGKPPKPITEPWEIKAFETASALLRGVEMTDVVQGEPQPRALYVHRCLDGLAAAAIEDAPLTDADVAHLCSTAGEKWLRTIGEWFEGMALPPLMTPEEEARLCAASQATEAPNGKAKRLALRRFRQDPRIIQKGSQTERP